MISAINLDTSIATLAEAKAATDVFYQYAAYLVVLGERLAYAERGLPEPPHVSLRLGELKSAMPEPFRW